MNTPGPWERVDCTRRDDTRIRAQFLHHGRAALWVEHDNTPEGYANEALAQAAPVMLFQLQVILARLDREPTDAIFPCSAMREDIRDVIAAATA